MTKQNCRGQRCNEGANDPLPTDDKCVDINKVAYCPLGTDLNKIARYHAAHNDLRCVQDLVKDRLKSS